MAQLHTLEIWRKLMSLGVKHDSCKLCDSCVLKIEKNYSAIILLPWCGISGERY